MPTAVSWHLELFFFSQLRCWYGCGVVWWFPIEFECTPRVLIHVKKQIRHPTINVLRGSDGERGGILRSSY